MGVTLDSGLSNLTLKGRFLCFVLDLGYWYILIDYWDSFSYLV